MAMVPFDKTNPSLNDPRAAVDVRNNLNALLNGDLGPLRPRAQETPDMTIAVAGCDVESFWRQTWVNTNKPLNYAGGNSPTVTAPNSNPRIDLLVIDSEGNLGWIVGTEAESPTPPDCPEGKIPICYIYCVTTMTKIYNFEDHESYPTHGYIYRDVRPFLNLGGGAPTGSISMYGGSSAPAGWLLCDGSAVSQTLYAALFAIIGYTYGNPGGGNFNLPDLRQRFPLGKAESGTGSTLGGTGGVIDHKHSFTVPLSMAVPSAGGYTGQAGTYNTATNNPPFQVVNFIIKT